MNLGAQAFQLLQLKYSRDDEREADRLGVGYAAHQGYAVEEGAQFFDSLKRIGEKEGLRIPNWLATHLDPGQREETIIKLAQQYERPNSMKMVGEDELLSHLQGVVVGENPREGFVQSGVFYHPDMKFQFQIPRGWKVKNDKSAVLLGEPNQRAMMALELTRAKTAQQDSEPGAIERNHPRRPKDQGAQRFRCAIRPNAPNHALMERGVHATSPSERAGH